MRPVCFSSRKCGRSLKRSMNVATVASSARVVLKSAWLELLVLLLRLINCLHRQAMLPLPLKIARPTLTKRGAEIACVTALWELHRRRWRKEITLESVGPLLLMKNVALAVEFARIRAWYACLVLLTRRDTKVIAIPNFIEVILRKRKTKSRIVVSPRNLRVRAW